jgi:glycosyl transferase family 25
LSLQDLLTLVINLDRTPHRMDVMASRLGDLGLPFERVSAVDGQELGVPPWDGIDHRGYELCHGKRLRPNEAGCYLSHVKAICQFIDSGSEFAMVLEDDAAFKPGTQAVLEALMAERAHWDVAKLNGRHSGTPVPQRRLTGDYRLVAFLTRNVGSGAYVINRHAGARYLKHLLPMVVPYDHSFDRAWRFGFKFRGVLPYPVHLQSVEGSTISRQDDGTYKKPWWRRGSVLAYRTQNETRRLAHYILRGLVIPRA